MKIKDFDLRPTQRLVLRKVKRGGDTPEDGTERQAYLALLRKGAITHRGGLYHLTPLGEELWAHYFAPRGPGSRGAEP